MNLAAAGDTWGISGPTFLLAYLVLAAMAWVLTARARRALADPGHSGAAPRLADRPYDVAHLNGGPELAVCSALSAMHLSGAISSQRGTVAAAGRLGPGVGELERAIHASAGTGVHRRRLPLHRPVAAALDAIAARLVSDGLLLSPERRGRIRGVGFWMLAVAGLGLLRLLAGIAEAKPVGFLVAAMAGVVAVAVTQLISAPRRSRLGDRTLAGLAAEHATLAPAMRPDWQAYGPAAAALGVGIWGLGALWASDPAFASELAVNRVAAGAGGSDGSGGGSGGDSGSSCGGGGGCGGGCGG